MSELGRTNTWRRLRGAFRWCRVAVLLLLLASLIALLYVSQLGLPPFLERPLLAELQRRGLSCQFQRLAWHWYRGLVAEQATLRAAADAEGLQAQVAELALNLNWGRLWREGSVEFESLRIEKGRLVIPLRHPGQPDESCTLEGVTAAVRFLPGGTWEIPELEASFLGATLQASGTITHALALARRPPTATGPDRPSTASSWQTPLRKILPLSRRLRFAVPPTLHLRFSGDGRQPASFAGELKGEIRGAQTPWFTFSHLRWIAELTPSPAPTSTSDRTLRVRVDLADARTPEGELRRATLTAETDLETGRLLPRRIDWTLDTGQARTPLAGFGTAHLSGHSACGTQNTGPFDCRTDLTIALGNLTSAWGEARTNRCTATVDHVLTSPIPAAAEVVAELEEASTRWGQAERLRLETRVTTLTNREPEPLDGWGAWARWAGLAASWRLAVTNVHSPRLTLDHGTIEGAWQPPHLTLTNVEVQLYGGSLSAASAHLDVGTRQASARFAADFDAHAVVPLLGRGASEWLAQFQWSRPPRVSAQACAVLPPWTTPPPHWASSVLPTVIAKAEIQGADAAFQGVPIETARLSVTMSNRVLRLRDFHVTRPEGDADLAYDLNTATQEFRWQLRANLDPKEVGPIIDRDAPRVLALFEFHGPAAVAGEVWGRWGPNKEINLALGGVVTNFVFRGEPVDELRAGVHLAHHVLTATNVALRTGAQWIQAGRIGVDFPNSWVHLTNAEAQFDPQSFARAIGSNLVNTLSPYRFDRPPRVRGEGRIPIRGAVSEADLRLQVAGGPFHFWRFNLPELSGQVHWEGDRVTLTNVVGQFYGGELRGHLRAEIQTNGSAQLTFRTAVTNISLLPLIRDTIPTTNRIEGTLQATLDIARANSADWKSWNGSGRLLMRDGLLWDLPVLSVLSPMLNAVVPGLGNNRARAATGSFTITDSVIQTDDLEIMAQPVRLAYRGTLDFDWNLRAQVEAEIIPGAPLIGPLLNIFLAPVSKALAFKIGGTLGDPRLEPLLVPKFLLPAFRPFQTLRGILTKERGPDLHPARSEN